MLQHDPVTALAAVAVCSAVEKTCGVRPGIKWTNALVSGKRKLTGILTELSLEAESGCVDYAVIGIGVNCCQELSDFPEELPWNCKNVSAVSLPL